MNSGARFIARTAVLSALAYVAAMASVYIPNVSLVFVVVFAAGWLFGLPVGGAVGAIGMFLTTFFNPLGPAPLPIMAAQIVGMVIVGGLGAAVSRRDGILLFALMGLISGLVYQLLVSSTLAALFGPFWPSFVSNLGFALLTIISNAIIFPLCRPFLRKLANRERRH